MKILFENFRLYDRDDIWCMEIRGGVIESLSKKEHFKGRGKFSKIYDLKENYLLPGFVDAHMHFSALVALFSAISLRECRSIEEMKERLKKDESDFVIGWGFDHELFKEKRIPTREDLDEVFKEVSIIIFRLDGHICVVNSEALKIIGIDKNTEDPEGGHIGRSPDGSPNGILIDNAIPSKYLLENPEMMTSLAQDFFKAQEALLSMGLTSVSDMGIDFDTLEIYRTVERAGLLKIRINAYLTEECLEAKEKIIDEMQRGKLVRVRGLKLFADGSFGANTGALFEEYSDDPGNTGIIRTPLGTLEDFVEQAEELGMQIAIHAIGDRGLFNALSALSKARNKELRHRVEHVQLVNKNLLKMMKDLGVVAVIQPVFIKSDSPWAESRLGKERVNYAYPLKSLIDHNIRVAGSSDCPVETQDPFLGIYFSSSDKDLDGNELPMWAKKERISIEDAITIFTEGAAYALHENKGKIEKGMLADFVVLPENPAIIGVEKIKDLKILKTFVGGELVYNSGGN